MEKRFGLSGVHLTIVILTAFVVVLPAIYNGFPLLYSDSGNYIDHAFSLIPSVDRPIGYSYFIRSVTWLASIWPIAFFQGLIGSWLIFLLLRVFLPAKILVRTFLIASIILGCFSSLGWYASFVTPDIFTSYIPLVIFLLLFAELKLFTRIFLYFLLAFIISMHFSHLAITLGILAIAFLFKWKGKWNVQYPRLAGILVSCILGHQVVCISNLSHHNDYTFSRSTYVFLMGRLSETGILNDYLKDNCNELNSNLCDYIDRLPSQAASFVWDHPSPFNINGTDWIKSNREYEKVVKDIVTTPKYWPSLIYKSMTATVRQLTRISIGSGIYAYDEVSSPYLALKIRKPNELNEYLHSRQNYKLLKMDMVNIIDGFLLLMSVILILIWSGTDNAAKEIKMLIGIVLIAYILNALVTGALANVYDRLQARMTWLIILSAVPVGFSLVKQATDRLQQWKT